MSLIEKMMERLAEEGTDALKSASRALPNPIDRTLTNADQRALKQRPTADAKAVSESAGLDRSQWLSPARRTTTRKVEVNFATLDKLGIVTPKSPNRRIEEELRIIKRRLLINVIGFGGKVVDLANVIMVTSSVPAEGKTFLSINLAFSIAKEFDRTALLVDVDTASRGVTRILGLDSSIGFTNLISRSDLDLADVICTTNIERLKVIPSGNRLRDMTEHLASHRTGLIVKDLAGRYRDRIVVIDCPPLLATTETCVLARMVGQIVVVVEAARTRQSDLLTALSLLDETKVIGLVLNKTAERYETNYYENYRGLYDTNQKQLPCERD
ncbi:MAG: AAA family ATPase [Pyrinomonadaceae bacterium]